MALRGLIGKQIKRVFVDAGRQHWIRFETDQGNLDYCVEGDCCSEAWIWAVSGVWYFASPSEHPRRVKEVRSVELPDFIVEQISGDRLCRQESDAVYSYIIVAEYGGGIEIEFRCSSNGYYGGWLGPVSAAPEDTEWVEVPSGYGQSYIADQKPEG